MSSSKLPEFPTDGGEDKALNFLKSLAKATTGSVPVLGPFLSEAIEFCYIRPIEKRRIDWFEELESALNELSKKVEGLTPAELAKNEEFITILHRATDVALRTHQSEKRRLLRNAVVSAGSLTKPELDKQAFFLRLVDELTINQVLVLLLYNNPVEWFKRRNRKPNDFISAARIEVLNQAYPEMVKDPDFKEVVLSELERRGLLHGLSGMVTGGSVYNPMTSKLGLEFLEYVKADSIEDIQQ
jgi:hypothetical protein